MVKPVGIKRYWLGTVCSLILIVLILGSYTAAASVPVNPENQGIEKQVKYDGEAVEEFYIPEDITFTDDSEVFYFAYMDLNEANEALKSKILQARNIVISNSSWVADGVNGYIENRDTGNITPLPHFHEIFPSDWDMPICTPGDYEQ